MWKSFAFPIVILVATTHILLCVNNHNFSWKDLYVRVIDGFHEVEDGKQFKSLLRDTSKFIDGPLSAMGDFKFGRRGKYCLQKLLIFRNASLTLTSVMR